MECDDQYARNQVRQFKADAVAQIVAPGLGHSKLLVSRVRRDAPEHGFATPAEPDAVFSILVQLRQQDRRELYLEDKLVHQGMFPKKTVSVVNHGQRPKANLLSAFDTVIFTIPQAALNEVAEDQGLPAAETLSCEYEGRVDQAIWSLTQSLMPALERPDEVGTLYAERVLLASTIYFAHVFGGMRPPEDAYRLSLRESGRAMSLLESGLQNEVSTAALASELGMTPVEFVRSFRRSVGKKPDGWLLERRIEHAKTLLRRKTVKYAEIATLCGFATPDQFVRAFTESVGLSPTVWRRQMLH